MITHIGGVTAALITLFIFGVVFFVFTRRLLSIVVDFEDRDPIDRKILPVTLVIGATCLCLLMLSTANSVFGVVALIFFLGFLLWLPDIGAAESRTVTAFSEKDFGTKVTVFEAFDEKRDYTEGRVSFGGEIWTARDPHFDFHEVGDTLTVIDRDNLVLTVARDGARADNHTLERTGER